MVNMHTTYCNNWNCVRYEGIWRSGGVAPLVPNLGNRRWRVVSFTLRSPYPRRAPERSGRFGKDKNRVSLSGTESIPRLFIPSLITTLTELTRFPDPYDSLKSVIISLYNVNRLISVNDRPTDRPTHTPLSEWWKTWLSSTAKCTKFIIITTNTMFMKV